MKPGTKIKGNVNGVIMEVVKIEPHKGGTNVVLKDCKTGEMFQYGLEALKKCNITILG